MDDLVEWLRAQFDEDERVALAIPTREWAEDSAWLADMLDPLPSQRRDRPSGWQSTITVDDVRHIARHDPARVLREVEAKRRILKRHHRRGDIWPDDRLYANACEGCGYSGDCDDPITEDINQCPELRDAALPYSDREGFDQSWLP